LFESSTDGLITPFAVVGCTNINMRFHGMLHICMWSSLFRHSCHCTAVGSEQHHPFFLSVMATNWFKPFMSHNDLSSYFIGLKQCLSSDAVF
jgi:hypothetical protein